MSTNGSQVPLDMDRLAVVIGRLYIENLGLAQQLEATQAEVARLTTAQKEKHGVPSDVP